MKMEFIGIKWPHVGIINAMIMMLSCRIFYGEQRGMKEFRNLPSLLK